MTLLVLCLCYFFICIYILGYYLLREEEDLVNFYIEYCYQNGCIYQHYVKRIDVIIRRHNSGI